MAQRMLGDGCDVCNPELAAQLDAEANPEVYPEWVRSVVREYLEVMDEWRRLTTPSSQWAQPRRIPHDHPIILRLRRAQTALAALAGRPFAT